MAIRTLNRKKRKAILTMLLNAAFNFSRVTQLGVVDDQLWGKWIATGIILRGEAVWCFNSSLRIDDSEDRVSIGQPDENYPSYRHSAIKPGFWTSKDCCIRRAIYNRVTKAKTWKEEKKTVYKYVYNTTTKGLWLNFYCQQFKAKKPGTLVQIVLFTRSTEILST